ncbi:aspartate semialdehyde dehydrogenase [Thiothrix eikelboomii]|uniref:Aspartate-semialdehyde dehydrogenase n=1 Tax=Thiothrix eikelboomii TaxID=92487 RepID=A0A1T4WPK0_9GAMM|nr:aspartate-semialdehyde dehydrogenase [Thiothrix eikelboomii]SKA79179.1 aspartate semialdehyde dehydrogenase [Thiothrix eikelboomii]
MTPSYDIAVVGATGLVGETLLSLLAERNFPLGQVYALASENSLGKEVELGRKTLDVEDLATFDFAKVQLAFFAVDAELAAEYVPIATQAGCIVIDNSAQFRDEADVPLVIPEVNPEALAAYMHRNLIASPSSSTIQLALALKPLLEIVKLTRIQVVVYEAASGAGRQAVDELAGQTASLLSGRPVESKVFAKQIAFNLLPQVDDLLETGHTEQELRLLKETRKVLSEPDLPLSPTVIRVPVFFGSSATVYLETETKLSLTQVRSLLENAKGIELVDENGDYPTPVVEAANNDPVYVGRLREDLIQANGLHVWLVVDNIRKGAALNSVQIAELLIAQARLK